MSFTRFHDDPCRIKKQLQESTDPANYMLNVPGNGLTPCYMDDPFIRMQKWGANLQTNAVNLESDLRGMTRGLNRDSNCENNYINYAVKSDVKKFPDCTIYTNQSRSTHPAWEFRDLEQNNFQYLPLNPQENTCIPFHNNLNTRILEKDNYIANAPCINNNEKGSISSTPFYKTNYNTNNLCTDKNSCGSYKK